MAALLTSAMFCLLPALAKAQDADDDDGPAKPTTEIIVTAKRLDAARANVDASLGASTYTLSNDTVESRPGGETGSIAQALLQVPGVVQDGSGQLHVRQSQGDLQYRINNVILPEGLSDLGESLSARIAEKVELVTGALPAQYGFQAGGVVNVTTKSGVYLDGGQAELYGGGPGEIEPAFEYGGSLGATNLFVSGSFLRSRAGLPAPDGSADPDHDRTDQTDGFVYLDHILDAQTRVGLILGLSDDRFQIPNLRGLDAATTFDPRAGYQPPLVVGGVTSFPSEGLDDRRREADRFAVASLLRASDQVTVQAAAFARESVRSERADGLGDLLFHGLATASDERDRAFGLQVEAAYELAQAHSLRGGILVSMDTLRSQAGQAVLPVDAEGRQTSDAPLAIHDAERVWTRKASGFLQDEWRPSDDLTINLGLRFDDVRAVRHDSRLSPRASVVWSGAGGATLHAGYARYFLPAPVEGAGETPLALAGTTGAAPTATGDPLRPETDDYVDVGVQQVFGGLTLGVDGYRRQARDLIAEGQFGPANLSRAFNYAKARLRGVEFSATFARGPFQAWSNLAIARAEGRGVVANQFYFTAAQLTALAARFTSPPQDQTVTGSAGASYRWGALKLSADLVYGGGLPTTPVGGAPNSGRLAPYAQLDLAAVWRVATFDQRPLDLRLDVVNAPDARYRLRDGRGLGDGLPLWGPRRGLFVGVEQSF